jgi:hypothetical protein
VSDAAAWQRNPARQPSTSSARLRRPVGARREQCAISFSISSLERKSGSSRLDAALSARADTLSLQSEAVKIKIRLEAAGGKVRIREDSTGGSPSAAPKRPQAS